MFWIFQMNWQPLKSRLLIHYYNQQCYNLPSTNSAETRYCRLVRNYTGSWFLLVVSLLLRAFSANFSLYCSVWLPALINMRSDLSWYKNYYLILSRILKYTWLYLFVKIYYEFTSDSRWTFMSPASDILWSADFKDDFNDSICLLCAINLYSFRSKISASVSSTWNNYV